MTSMSEEKGDVLQTPKPSAAGDNLNNFKSRANMPSVKVMTK